MARRAQITLATDLGNGSTTGVDYQGGNTVIFVSGTFGGATYTLEVQGPDGLWYSVGAGTSFTAQGLAGFLGPAGQYRLTGVGGAGNSVDAYLVGIPSNAGG